ncbi:MAG: RNA-binding domain-containing protein [Bacteroidales bacterium]
MNENIKLLDRLIKLQESEYIEFKENFHSAEEIGERISALSNSACLHNKPCGFLIFGVNDKREIIGTTFNARNHKKGNEIFELWLINRLNPKLDFETIEFDYTKDKHISMFKIPAASGSPVQFQNTEYIRINSATRRLSEFREKEEKIWKKDSSHTLIRSLVKDGLSVSDIISLLNTETYFELIKTSIPNSQQAVINRFCKENLVLETDRGYAITYLGAILFAKNLEDFDRLNRKAIRVIVYKGKSKIETIREQIGKKGYAVGFVGLIDWILGQLPQNEEIGKALRKDVQMYPQIAIRELVANSIIHQDFTEKGAPTIEIYADRIDISNPGVPIIDAERFIDEYSSRNDYLADIMRRMGFCEEKGSGLDKVVFNNELYQLPPVNILVQQNRTVVTMYSYKKLNHLDKKEKLRACYQHACLKYVSNEKMTNQTLRERFQIEDHNYSIASRIIKEAITAGLIKEEDEDNKSRKFAKYVPFWA